MRPATIDFETRSECSLRNSGSWTYSQHPTTQVLCLAFRLPKWRKGETALWHPAFPQAGLEESTDRLDELFRWILHGYPVEAHNAWFERGIWINQMIKKFGWPTIAGDQWRCSAAKAAALAFPRHLDDLAAALRVRERKDVLGGKVMQKMSKPRKSRKKEREQWQARHGDAPMPTLWWETPELFHDLFDYCRQDVLTEECVSEAMPDLSPDELGYYLLDQTINQRGFRLDTTAVNAALTLIDTEVSRLNGELQVLTKGRVKKATQRAQMKKWLAEEGLFLVDTQASTLDDELKREGLPERARQGLVILRELGRSSTAKYETMRAWGADDERAHGGLLYHGASTGRWSGAGIQPHNFPRAVAKSATTGKKASQEDLWAHVTEGDLSWIEDHGGIMKVLSAGLRGAIVPSRGRKLFVADYASIEARVLLWLARDEGGLDIFRSGRDIYCEMASEIYDRPINKNDHPDERQLGKAAILGLGYQMGASKFVDTAFDTYGITITEAFSQGVVEAYRTKYWRVKDMWWAQHDAAITATKSGRPVKCGYVVWEHTKGDKWTYCVLPSGRRLAYPYPEVREKEVPWGGTRPAFTYMGINPLNHQWQRQSSYGGLLVENIVQAVSRDIMAEAMIRCEDSGVYFPVLSVHDEVVAEAHPLLGDLSEFEELVKQCPEWADGCPIEAEGWTGDRYKK